MKSKLAPLTWLLAALCLVSLATKSHAQQNLLANPGFETGTTGWANLWTRTAGTGTMAIDEATRHDGQHSLKVTHTGAEDWSVGSSQTAPVTAGDIFTIGGWLKCEAVDDAEISVATERAAGDTIDWMYGKVGTSGTHDWREFKRKFVVPDGCTQIQFRLTGRGKGTIWFDDARLVKEGNVSEFRGGLPGKALHVGNALMNVTLDTEHGTLIVTDRRNQRMWQQQPFSEGVIVKSAQAQGKNGLRLQVWDVANDLTLGVTLALSANKPELTMTLDGTGAVSQPVAFPQPFVSGQGSVLVVPLNEGILYPVDDASIRPMQLVTYGGHGICMPWYGIADTQTGAGAMAIIGTPDDARIDITRHQGGELYIQPEWEASRGQFSYVRHITYSFFDKGGYVAQAKRYRDYAQQVGLYKTLVQKRRENPNVDRLLGAVNIWNWDMDKVTLCNEMKALGMDHVLWSSGGKPEEIAAINKLGYLTSRYDIYQDVWEPNKLGLRSEGWPEDLVWLPNGDWMKGWAHIQKNADGTTTTYQGAVICSPRGLARAKQEIPADLATHPYQCRFLDTTTASPWRECYNPAHPLTRSQDRHYKMALLDFCSKDMKQVVGTETGIDPSVPYADYYEGMMSLGPYRLPDAGRDTMQYKAPTPDFLKFQVGHFYRIPLWELVYHDCTVAQWYWGDYNNKAPEVWQRRDLFNILYGTPPMFMFDKTTWAKDKAHFAKSYRDICPLVRRLATAQMMSHEFLTPDHAVQRTRWSEGTVVTVNFGDTAYKPAGGPEIPPLVWAVQSRPR